MTEYLIDHSNEQIDTEVLEAVRARGISRLMHFTTNRGLVGILATRACKSAPLLKQEDYLEYILTTNCPVRYESPKWQSYVNLSVEHINASFFGICEDGWHRNSDFWWCVLDFTPEVAAHDGVVFANTNNRYTGVSRKFRVDGFQALFDIEVVQWHGRSVRRDTTRESYPTCPQAEVLYPLEVSTRYLQRVFVRTDEHAAAVSAMAKALGQGGLEITVDSTVFEARR